MTTKQRAILEGAIELIREGWIQGEGIKRINGVKCRCAAFAIFDACAIEDYQEERDVKIRVLESIRPLGFSDIPSWNDAPGRTQDEVIALFQSILDDHQS